MAIGDDGLCGGCAAPALGDPHRQVGRRVSLRKTATVGALTCTSIALSNILLFNLVGNRVLYGTLGLVFWSDVLALIASYVILLPAVRACTVANSRPRGEEATRVPRADLEDAGGRVRSSGRV
jgi:hypothetical protein